MWVGQLGSGVGIFNGIFQVTAVSLGIDLFIYIVSALVLLIVYKCCQLNNEEPARTSAGSSNVEVQSIGFPGLSSLAGLPPRTIAEHPLIVLFSVLGMSLISISVVIFISLAGEDPPGSPFHMYVSLLLLLLAWLTTMPKIPLFLFILEFQGFALLYNWSTWCIINATTTVIYLIVCFVSFSSYYLFLKVYLIKDFTFFMFNITLLHSLHLLALYNNNYV